MGVPVIPCGCSQRTGAVRRTIRGTIAKWEQEHPRLRESIISAMGNIEPGRLLDTRYFGGESVSSAPELLPILNNN